MVEEGLYPLIIAAQVDLEGVTKKVSKGVQSGKHNWPICSDLDALPGQLQEKSRGTTVSFLGVGSCG